MTAWEPDPRPLFARVVDDIVSQIREGRLRPGQRIGSTRELSEQYGVASMTALRAMRELQTLGATFGMVGKGTFVRPDAVARLTTPPFSPDCGRCEDEAAYVAHLMAMVGRCHRLADQLDAHTMPEVAHVAGEVRRLASVLAGGVMEHANHLDRSSARHHHDNDDD